MAVDAGRSGEGEGARHGTHGPRTGVLFVCLGNICRSPLAKGIFTHLARERGVLDRFEIDSCGTGGWHVGKGADPRTLEVAQRHGVPLPHVARQLEPRTDFARFRHILAMDQDNLRALLHAGAPPERVSLLRSHDPALQGEPTYRQEVPDPYYGDGDGFERVYDMVHAACAGLLDELTA